MNGRYFQRQVSLGAYQRYAQVATPTSVRGDTLEAAPPALSPMAFFEGFRRRSAEKADASREALGESIARANAAEGDLAAADRKAAYAQARLAELTADLREEVRLRIEAQAAEASLERARQLRPLTQRILELHRRRQTSDPELDTAIQKDADAANELMTREHEHAQALEALAATRIRIQAREAELRSRFDLEKE